MSLLLLFPGGKPGWTIISKTSTGWTVSHYDFKNIWQEWQAYTWGQIGA